jgi:hypothetical protein
LFCVIKGSDGTTFDWLTMAPEGTLVAMAATSRYPNELVRIARRARRKDMERLTNRRNVSSALVFFKIE